MSLNLQQLAKALRLEFRGDAGLAVNGVASPKSALAGELCFVQDRKYLGDINASDCSAVILTAELAGDVSNKSLLLSDNPQYSFVEAIKALGIESQAQDSDDIHPTAVVADTARLGKGVTVGALVVIEDDVEVGPGTSIGAGSIIERSAKIGGQCHLHSRVTLGSAVNLGDHCILHSGVVIGSDGFGLVMHEQRWEKVPQLGSVTIEDDVEIGANTTVDRGALDDTIIERGCKLDNQIQVAHNVRIGAHTAIAACVGIAGSANIGRHCKISGAAVVLGHLTVTDNVTITAMSLVTKDIKEPGVYSSGTPLLENSLWHRCNARYKSLDKLAQTVAKLEKSEK
jgi:UDP-3-O-[3-hydroxymyristoyl] glucosamine N-acyltransferase